MICLYADTHFSTFALIFYACIWIPFAQILQAVVRFFTFLIDPHHQPENNYSEGTPVWELELPISKFQDLDKNVGEAIESEEMCSICLMEFEKEDLVNKLPRCGHIFHMGCLEKWLDRCQFTCPLCRSLVWHVRSPPCKMWASAFCVNLPTAHDA